MDMSLLLALAGTGTAALGIVKLVVDHLVRIRERRVVDGETIRGDLAKRVSFLEEQREKDLTKIAEISGVVDEWQQQYHDKNNENALLKNRVAMLEQEAALLKTELSRLRARLARYEHEAHNGALSTPPESQEPEGGK